MRPLTITAPSCRMPGAEVDVCPGFVIPENDAGQVNTWEQSAPVLAHGEARDIRLSNGRLPARERFAMNAPWVKLPLHLVDDAALARCPPIVGLTWCHLLTLAARQDKAGRIGTRDEVVWMLHSDEAKAGPIIDLLTESKHIILDWQGYYWIREWDKAAYVPMRSPIPLELRLAIYARDGWRCVNCGEKGRRIEIDHILPHSLGGPTTEDNLQTLCQTCNREKSNRTMEEWKAGLPASRRKRSR